MTQTKIDYVMGIIEAFDLESLDLATSDYHRIRDHLQLRLQKLPNVILDQVLNGLKAPEPPPDVEIDPWSGWVVCVAEELPPQSGTDICCDSCGAGIGEGCRTASGNPTRYHIQRTRVDGRRNRDLERGAWFRRAKAGEVDFCKCSGCYGIIKQSAEIHGISCEEMEHKIRTEWV